MKTFWILMLILALATVGYFVMRESGKSDEDRLEEEVAAMMARIESHGEAIEALPEPAVEVAAMSAPASTGAASGTAAPTPVASVAEQTPTAPAATQAVVATQPAASAPATLPASTAAAGESMKDGLDQKIISAEVKPGVIVRQADGSIRVDDRFTLVGAGTKEDPYLLTWEYLMSASETYRPREGKREMPQRIALLHGKWIRIQGNVAFPLAATSPKEILVMLNMWDGCCIGLPPTPYDAIEVRLAEAAPASRRHTMTYGTLTGKMSVEPYLVETWLAGLYLMDDAVLDQGL